MQLPNEVWTFVSHCQDEGYIPDGDDLDAHFGYEYSLSEMCNIIDQINLLTPKNHDIDKTRYYFKEETIHGTKTFQGAF